MFVKWYLDPLTSKSNIEKVRLDLRWLVKFKPINEIYEGKLNYWDVQRKF